MTKCRAGSVTVLGTSNDCGDDSCGDSDDLVVEVVMVVMTIVFLLGGFANLVGKNRSYVGKTEFI